MNHIARQLEKHLDDLEEVVATREQRLSAVSRLTQRRAEQVKASLKAQVCSMSSNWCSLGNGELSFSAL